LTFIGRRIEIMETCVVEITLSSDHYSIYELRDFLMWHIIGDMDIRFPDESKEIVLSSRLIEMKEDQNGV
jgi:hypothetical protein